MPQRRRAPVRLPARFDDLAFAEDLRHATPAGRDVARAARARFEHDGAELGELAPCDPEHRGGTRLPGCVKAYLPAPGDRWRMIFEFVRDTASGEIVLAYRAFGVGHPGHAWQPSTYDVAHNRLHGIN